MFGSQHHGLLWGIGVLYAVYAVFSNLCYDSVFGGLDPVVTPLRSGIGDVVTVDLCQDANRYVLQPPSPAQGRSWPIEKTRNRCFHCQWGRIARSACAVPKVCTLTEPSI